MLASVDTMLLLLRRPRCAQTHEGRHPWRAVWRPRCRL